MVEPPAGIKKIMENEVRIADMASAATRLSSMNLPSFDVPYMAGAMEMAHAMSQLPKPVIAPHISQIMKEISDRMDAIVAPARESQALEHHQKSTKKAGASDSYGSDAPAFWKYVFFCFIASFP